MIIDFRFNRTFFVVVVAVVNYLNHNGPCLVKMITFDFRFVFFFLVEIIISRLKVVSKKKF